MSYLDDYRTASFKGFVFLIDSHSATEGRNIQVNEFPGKDVPFAEDINKAAGNYTFSAYLISEDYFQDRDAFRDILKSEGPGILIHPYLGRIFVQSGKFTFSENTAEGRMVRFDLNFFETEEEPLPNSSEDLGATMDTAGDNVELSAVQDFEDTYDLTDQAGFLFESALEAWDTMATTFSDTVRFVKDAGDLIAEMAFLQREFVADLDKILNTPSALMSHLQDSFDLLNNAPSVFDRLTAFKSFFDFGEEGTNNEFPIFPATTDTRKNQIINDNETKKVMQTVAVSHAAKQLTQITFASRNDAIAEREIMIDQINRLLSDETISDESFQTLSDLKAIVVRAIPNEDDDLKNLASYETTRTTNSIVVSYDASESLDIEQDLIDRNDIDDPGEIPSDTVLEVLP